ncbi:MAG: glycine cleavage system protein GcvH [Planctomycetes bacterium]|nr:glycine cleavage system protein GcvH [Planctomycetota bacterium]MCB9911028.1 glycine cleavage system protein GcvH [Planctomycetota bacterium]HPF14432.1 glycine cleavage system protein GcvH [Planctomycetota bacterium]HRV82495.1 glycine cleavage system protein GcvH [Planctomycetota bacterium]
MRPNDRKYSTSHEWAKKDGDTIVVGITDFAIEELSSGNTSDLVYCDLPDLGRILEVGETFGEIESVKAVADLNAPIGGEVVEVNSSLEEHLEKMAEDPWGAGWLVRIKPSGSEYDELMDAEAYEKHIAAPH